MPHRDTRVWAGPALGSWDHVALKWALGTYGAIRAPIELPRHSGAGTDALRLLPVPLTCAKREVKAQLGLCSRLICSGGLATAGLVGHLIHARLCSRHRVLVGTAPDQPFLWGSQTPQPALQSDGDEGLGALEASQLGLWGQRPEGLSGGGGAGAAPGVAVRLAPGSGPPFTQAQRL